MKRNKDDIRSDEDLNRAEQGMIDSQGGEMNKKRKVLITITYNEMGIIIDTKAEEVAQPEPLTDKEQRIFLAAMEREEKVCKEVDEECRDCREPYEDSLVKTCHEITRKVKDALWMI